MTLATLLGLIACLLTTGSFLPQIIKTIRTKDTKSLSLGMYLVYLTGVMFWFAYGFMIGEIAILVGNTFSLIFGLIMLVMKLKYK